MHCSVALNVLHVDLLGGLEAEVEQFLGGPLVVRFRGLVQERAAVEDLAKEFFRFVRFQFLHK